MRVFSKFLAIFLTAILIATPVFAAEAVKGSSENPYKWKDIPATWIKQVKKDNLITGYTITVAEKKTASFKLSGTQFKEYRIKGNDGKFGEAVALTNGKLKTIKNVSAIRVVLRNSASGAGGGTGSTPDKPLVENSNPQKSASSKAESSEANVKPGKSQTKNGYVLAPNGKYYVQPGGPFAEPSSKVKEQSFAAPSGGTWFTNSGGWMSDIGAWRGTDAGGNDVLCFPGGGRMRWSDYMAVYGA